MTAWVLVRYRLPGKRFIDAIVDLPFALPTAVAGITLATTILRPDGWIGQILTPARALKLPIHRLGYLSP
jgi:sulfate/thiosulfate transport system permease protein